MFKKILNKLPDLFLAILVAFSLTYALASSSLCMQFPLAEMLLIITLCIVSLCLLFCSKKVSRISIIVLGVAFAASVVYMIFFVDMKLIIDFLKEYSFWFYDYFMYPTGADFLYQKITVISLSIIVSLLSYIFVIKKFRFFTILIAGMGLFGFQASYKIVSGNIPFYLFLLAVLISYLKYIFNLKASKGSNEYAKPATIVMWSIPVSILIIFLSMSIHASDRPITWNWLDRKFVSAYNYFQKKFDYETFDYFSLSKTSGFGNSNSLLGGSVRLDRKSVLRVITNKRIYLSGVSRDVYTGNMWINSNEELEASDNNYSGLYDDTKEMLTGMKLLTGKDDYFKEYFDSNVIDVTFLNLKTKSLFKPTKTKEFDSITDEISAYISDTGDLSSESRLKKNYEYSITSYVPKMGTEFDAVMRISKKGLYKEYLQRIEFPNYFNVGEQSGVSFAYQYEGSGPGETLKVTITDKTKDIQTKTFNLKEEELRALEESSKLIYDKYLQLPEELPQRVKDLAASLTTSSENDYDKAKEIEKYLASNYSYNLDVRSAPRDRDFVDYFLFEQKEGYCSYFASAMTILARCAGLPARYVEGYMLPPDTVKNRENMYIVTNMQAHAWVEIYFEGYGWLPFEPTSPFRSAFYSTQVPEQVSYSPDYNPSYQEYMEMMMKYYGQGGTNGPIDLYTGDVVKGPSAGVIILYSIAGAVALMLMLMLFNTIRSRVRIFRLINLPARECILGSYKYYLSVLKLHGLGLMPAETPGQYSERIDSELFFSPVRFKVITEIFVKSRYSLQEASEKEKLLYSDFYQGFLDEIKINMGKTRYFIMRYLFGKI